MSDTRRRILDTARRLFNEEGLSRVGVRDVARALEMSPGNLAYHFPTKDDLVEALVVELCELNLATVFADIPSPMSIETLYRLAMGAMRNMVAYRFVLLGYADAVSRSRRLRKLEATLGEKRRARHEVMLAAMVEGEWIEREALARSEVLYEQSTMISSGWMSVAAVRGWTDRAAIPHFAKLGCALLEPHCTPKGKKQMRRVLAGELDAKGES
ncbi:MAG TPA: TetR family transcriptional regulator [Polyangiaceae bacterium]|jgi:AcrR family transcriptional regulator